MAAGELADSHEVTGWLERRLLLTVERLVPRHRRAEWRREWLAELWHLRMAGREVAGPVSLTRGIVADAACLRWEWLRASAPGSGVWCLAGMLAGCLFALAVELVLTGSVHGLMETLTTHFLHSFAFVAAPAIFAAMVTYPMRELRWERREGWLSARARWNAFMAAKVALTLGLVFLVTVIASYPVEAAIGRWACWVELISSAVVVTASLRWALLNQEHRCQRCLRILREPTRVGMASRNFLDWSGTELVCGDGHGLLHVAEMQGSWCWYDRWVEAEPGFLSFG